MASTTNITIHSAINHETPNVLIYTNQTLAARSLAHYRRETEKAAQLRISLQRYDTVGYLTHSLDARLSEDYLQDPDSTIPNQRQVNTLSGAVLQSKNADAGMRVSISDIRGLMLWTNDSLGNKQTFEYDTLGRVTSVHETAQGKKTVCCERFVYGDNTAKAINGIGRLLKHYDTAGLHEINSYRVFGNILNENRQFLATSTDVDWPEELTGQQHLLEQQHYSTQWNYNGLGETIGQTDAKGNQRNTQYGIAGEIFSSGLLLKAGTEQTVISKQTYNAAGQLLAKHLANGVVIQYHYEEKTQRLTHLHSLRLSDNKSLQDLNYRYDPVGNILEIIDKAKEPGFYANEKTETISQYRYDSLYQLIEAKGIESQQAIKESTTRNLALRLGNPDASRCVNYTRNYEYDAGNNLYSIQHRGAQSYTQSLEIETQSNRGIEKRDSGPSLVESFDSNGNLLYLNTAQPLQWDSRNQLQQVIQLKRETLSDKEQYRYNANGQRVEKLTQQLSQEQIHSKRVRYLAGLELREHWQTDVQGGNKKVTEQLYVIQSNDIRVLHWETGKPDDIENDSLRYSLTDQLGSTQLELNTKGKIISYESYYPYGGTAIWATKNTIETHYQFIHYSGKEQDASGLYYYGYRYYIPWLGRWLNPDPSGISEGLNLYCMLRNNPINFYDINGEIRTPVGTPKLPHKKIEAESNQITAATASSLTPSSTFNTIYNPRIEGGIIEVSPSNCEKIFKLLHKPGYKQTWSRQSKDYELPENSIKNPSLSEEELNEIRNYTEDIDLYIEEASLASQKISEAVAKLIPQQGVVFRGSYAKKGVYGMEGSKGYKIYEGDIVTNDRLMSTAFSAITTDAFNLDPKVGVTESMFFLIESISGRNISQFSAEEYQNEVLHLRNRNFRVNKIKQYKNAFGIKIKYVSLSEVEGPFIFQENDLSMIRSLAKNIYTGE